MSIPIGAGCPACLDEGRADAAGLISFIALAAPQITRRLARSAGVQRPVGVVRVRSGGVYFIRLSLRIGADGRLRRFQPGCFARGMHEGEHEDDREQQHDGRRRRAVDEEGEVDTKE